jgi:DNA-binding NarL/FixJ family response regulator
VIHPNTAAKADVPSKKTMASVDRVTGVPGGTDERSAVGADDPKIAGRVRVVLVDDHTIVRQGVRALLGATPDIVVVGEASDAEGCFRLVAAETPDVAVVDLSLPGMHGTEVVSRLKSSGGSGGGVGVVVLSMHAAPEVVARARAAGCDAYVVKGGDVAELAEAIRAVARGGSYFSSAVAVVATGKPDGVRPVDKLSARERQILGLIARSGTNKTIAAELGISVHTVNAHRTSLMTKLDIHDAQALTRFAVEHGLVPSDE